MYGPFELQEQESSPTALDYRLYIHPTSESDVLTSQYYLVRIYGGPQRDFGTFRVDKYGNLNFVGVDSNRRMSSVTCRVHEPPIRWKNEDLSEVEIAIETGWEKLPEWFERFDRSADYPSRHGI